MKLQREREQAVWAGPGQESSRGQVFFRCLPAGLLSASSNWGLGVRAEHLVSSDDFQGGGGRSSPEMSDTSGASHNSDSGGGSGTWKGEPEMEGEKKAIQVSRFQAPTFKPRCGPTTHQATALHNV